MPHNVLPDRVDFLRWRLHELGLLVVKEGLLEKQLGEELELLLRLIERDHVLGVGAEVLDPRLAFINRLGELADNLLTLLEYLDVDVVEKQKQFGREIREFVALIVKPRQHLKNTRFQLEVLIHAEHRDQSWQHLKTNNPVDVDVGKLLGKLLVLLHQEIEPETAHHRCMLEVGVLVINGGPRLEDLRKNGFDPALDLLIKRLLDLANIRRVVYIKLLLLDLIVQTQLADPFPEFELQIIQVKVHNEI